ncbi:unnamed protein product [Brassica oleracea var. botrytis]|uniref:(rape) hypothetical protein n=1 Tax=Brassica napus TaxID=3708 RepID=A0A816JDV4_BRANA|nr:unnamed protein product [Brassica napus]
MSESIVDKIDPDQTRKNPNFASSFGDARRCAQAPKDPTVDIQAAVGWGVAAAAGAIWVVQPFDWIKKTFIDKPATEEN